MSEQQSNKSDSEKRAPAPNSPAGGKSDDRESGKDAAHGTDSGRLAQRRKQWDEMERSEDV